MADPVKPRSKMPDRKALGFFALAIVFFVFGLSRLQEGNAAVWISLGATFFVLGAALAARANKADKGEKS